MTDQARMDGKAQLRGKDAKCPVCHTDNLCFDGLRLGSTGVPCEGCGTLMDVVDQEYDTYFGALIPVYGVAQPKP